MAKLSKDDVAPEFAIADVDGERVELSSVLEHGDAVLAFFPKAFTPG